MVLLLTLPFIGCGNKLCSVSGTVSIDGTPVSGGDDGLGTVSFYRESGGAPGIGFIDKSGRYDLKTGGQAGIEPGPYRIAINIKKIAPPVNQDALPKATLISHPKYGRITESGLRADVKTGQNTIDFALSSKGP
ncbi:MAG TPA: hypothetical protein VHU84_14075 [Lacipirellulaceae bacterium]|nr:hypothetical protein [Lacipirellulaceae bacterium]